QNRRRSPTQPYFLGTKIHNPWAIVGSEGIIVLEALYDYAAQDEIFGGMKRSAWTPVRSNTSSSRMPTPTMTAEPGCFRMKSQACTLSTALQTGTRWTNRPTTRAANPSTTW